MCPAMESIMNVKNESIAAIIMIILIVKNSIILSILMQNYCFLLELQKVCNVIWL